MEMDILAVIFVATIVGVGYELGGWTGIRRVLLLVGLTILGILILGQWETRNRVAGGELQQSSDHPQGIVAQRLPAQHGSQDLGLDQPAPTYPVPTIEKLTSYPSAMVVPDEKQPTADLDKLAHAKTNLVISSEPGGSLDAHQMRFKAWAALGAEVEIRGMCQSACTLVMSYVPRERICFSKSGYLNFHLASYDGHNVVPSLEHTRWMIENYPADIRAWIEAKGGAAKMPQWTFWRLRADDLWKMGYRKCDG